MSRLDEDMKDADPATRLRDDRGLFIDAMVDELVGQRTRAPRRWQRWKTTTGVGVVAVLALTGAAASVPLVLGIGGHGVDLDATIPVKYVTTTGVTVECVYGVHLGSADGRTPDVERAADLFAERDWTGIGQEIHDWALAHPVAPRQGEVWTDDTAELRDQISFRLAVSPVLLSKLPPDLQDSGIGFSSTSTCSGRLR